MTHNLTLDIPILATDRLLMRGFTPDDFEAYAEMMADPDVSRNRLRPKVSATADSSDENY